MGRFLNTRLKEHDASVKNSASLGHLPLHCWDCGCKPLFCEASVKAGYRNQTIRDVHEASLIAELGVEHCVSVLSLALLSSDVLYLHPAATDTHND